MRNMREQMFEDVKTLEKEGDKEQAQALLDIFNAKFVTSNNRLARELKKKYMEKGYIWENYF